MASFASADLPEKDVLPVNKNRPRMSFGVYVGDQHRRLFLRPAKPVAAWIEREHQWPAETVLSSGHRLVGAFASPSEQSGSPTKRTAT